MVARACWTPRCPLNCLCETEHARVSSREATANFKRKISDGCARCWTPAPFRCLREEEHARARYLLASREATINFKRKISRWTRLLDARAAFFAACCEEGKNTLCCRHAEATWLQTQISDGFAPVGLPALPFQTASGKQSTRAPLSSRLEATTDAKPAKYQMVAPVGRLRCPQTAV
jgi:hypothetical protein